MKKTNRVFMALLCATITAAISCSKSSEDKLSAVGTSTCDTANSTYTADVSTILKANCYSCHGNGNADGGINLDTYDNVKSVAQSGALLGTITHATEYPPMPQGQPQLSDCDINTIRSWINNGIQNK